VKADQVAEPSPRNSLASIAPSGDADIDEHQQAAIGGSTVANALAELLELARSLGADETHPAVARTSALLHGWRFRSEAGSADVEFPASEERAGTTAQRDIPSA
jgi:hypothetical protein